VDSTQGCQVNKFCARYALKSNLLIAQRAAFFLKIRQQISEKA